MVQNDEKWTALKSLPRNFKFVCNLKLHLSKISQFHRNFENRPFHQCKRMVFPNVAVYRIYTISASKNISRDSISQSNFDSCPFASSQYLINFNFFGHGRFLLRRPELGRQDDEMKRFFGNYLDVL